MARGKQAALAASRRHEAAMEHIDRLTNEITSLKLRTRDAEQRAATAEIRVQRAENEVEAYREDVDRCVEYVDAHLAYYKASRKEWEGEPKKEFMKLLVDSLPLTEAATSDRVEFLFRRYPNLMSWLGWEDAKSGRAFTYRSRHMEGMTVDAAKSLQRVRGDRILAVWDRDRDLADVMNDMLDIGQMELDEAEIYELLNVEPPRRRKVDT